MKLSRPDRGTLLTTINTRRAAIQHAADGIWEASHDSSRPIRKTFSLPLNRAMGL